MGITIVQGGQTGVDRGAAFAARSHGVPFAGFLPSGAFCEAGAVPAWLLENMRQIANGGLRARTYANLRESDFVLAIVADRQAPWATDGTAYTLQHARKLGLPSFTCDALTPLSVLLARIQPVHARITLTRPDLRLMVCGPRASLWIHGERVAYGIVSALCQSFDVC